MVAGFPDGCSASVPTGDCSSDSSGHLYPDDLNIVKYTCGADTNANVYTPDPNAPTSGGQRLNDFTYGGSQCPAAFHLQRKRSQLEHALAKRRAKPTGSAAHPAGPDASHDQAASPATSEFGSLERPGTDATCRWLSH